MTVLLEPPFDRCILETLVVRTAEVEELDIRHMVEWLIEHGSDRGLVQGIQKAWKSSSLPLAGWANDVLRVEAVTSDDYVDIMLRVQLAGGRVVRQEPPLYQYKVAEFKRSVPFSMPAILEDLLLSAPRLGLRDAASLVRSEFFARPLFHVLHWHHVADPEMVSSQGYHALDPAVHAVEVADVGGDSYYLLGTDLGVHYFDSDIPGSTPCLLSLTNLIELYFRRPEQIEAPYENRLANRPLSWRPPADPVHSPAVLLHLLERRLTNLGSLALAVRGCQRGTPAGCGVRLPEDWDAVFETLEETIDDCRQVCVSGVPLQAEVASKKAAWAHEHAGPLFLLHDQAIRNPRAQPLAAYLGHVLCFAVMDLVELAAFRHVEGGATSVVGTVLDKIPAARVAAIADAKALLALVLGEPETIGKPVSAGFFRRPLWSG